MNFSSLNFTRYILERNHNQTQDDNYTINVWVRQDFALLRWKNIRINFPCWNLLMFLQLYYVLWLRASFLLSVSCMIVEEVGGAQSRVRYSIKNEIEESAATKGIDIRKWNWSRTIIYRVSMLQLNANLRNSSSGRPRYYWQVLVWSTYNCN